MKEGDIVLTPIPQADGRVKNRPALILRKMPPYGNFLICGISTQLHQAVPDFDELITAEHDDFPHSGLLADSIMRLGFLAVVTSKSIVGGIGSIPGKRHERLLVRLSAYLVKEVSKLRKS